MSMNSKVQNAIQEDRQKLAEALKKKEEGDNHRYIGIVESSYGCPNPMLVTAVDDDAALEQAKGRCQPWQTVVRLLRLEEVYSVEIEVVEKSLSGDYVVTRIVEKDPN